MATRKSPFPTGFTGVDLFYDGDWQDITSDLKEDGFQAAHGARSEGSRADPSSLSFTVTNSDGKYSPRNPQSPLYGLVGRNTPARARVSLGAPWIDLETPGARATSPDVANLDITSDIDIRWWGYRESWDVAADLISKWNGTGNQRSWLLRAEANGTLTLFWSADGTTVLEARTTVTVPVWAGCIALRVTLDVNDGAGGHAVTFEYADTLSLALAPDTASWTPMGDPVTGVGTTSIFNSTAALTLGKEPTSVAGTPPQRVYGWSLRNGIGAGQVVRSECIASDLTVGATGFTVTGETFTITDGSVSNTHVLAVCEVAEWPVDWNTKGAPSVMTEVRASGVTRRLGQGAQAVESVLYRAISGISNGMVGYWPLEDGSDATAFGAAVGTRAAAMGSEVTPAAYDSFPGSAPLPTLGGSRIRAEVDTASNTGQVQVRWVQWTPNEALPVAEVVLARVEFATGGIGHADLRLRDSDGRLGVFGYDFDGVELSGSTFFATTSIKGTSQRLSLELEQNGADLDFRFVKLAPGDTSGTTGSGTFTFPRTLGIVRRVILNPQYRELPNVAMGHLTVENDITSIFDVFGGALVGHRGEQADNRMLRLASENSVGLTVRGRWATPMGEQQEETLLDLLAEAASADGGILHDDLHAVALRYRTLDALGSQPAVTIPYTDNLVIPFEPTDDDGLTRNRVTVSRPNGTRITHERLDGPLSIAAPPEGVGLYDESLTLNLDTDDLVDRTAAWRVHVGTWDEGRYPTLGVDLAHPYFLSNPVLTRQLLSMTPGDRLVITDPPPWLPPLSVDVLVMGVQIEVTPLHLRLRWTCVPARPYRIGYWNSGHRYSGAGTVLSGPVTTTATTLNLTTPNGISWTHVDGDYDVLVGGELMTVTDVVGTAMTVTRSVNSVVKTHAAGAAVDLAEPSFYAR